MGMLDFGLRKSAHMIEFGVLSLLLWQAIRQHRLSGFQAVFGGSALALIYAFSDEFHQHFVRGRHGTIRDVGFDLAGITIAMTIASIASKRRQDTARVNS